MQFVELITLVENPDFVASQMWKRIISDLRESIEEIKWPIGSKKFTIFADKGRGRGQGNGVVPIKKMFLSNLEKRGWKLEERMKIATRKAS